MRVISSATQRNSTICGEDDENTNGVITLIVNAAIAYADALTGKYGGFFNQQDHKTVRPAVERALGRRADPTQLKRLSAIIGQKDPSSYGARRSLKKTYAAAERTGFDVSARSAMISAAVQPVTAQ